MAEKVSQKELVRVVSAMTGEPMYRVDTILKAFNEAIRSTIFNKKDLFFPHIGTLTLKKLKAGVYSTPMGHSLYVDERYKPTFKFTQQFKKIISRLQIEKQPTPDNDLPFEE